MIIIIIWEVNHYIDMLSENVKRSVRGTWSALKPGLRLKPAGVQQAGGLLMLEQESGGLFAVHGLAQQIALDLIAAMRQ
jgi:hypothetical protein